MLTVLYLVIIYISTICVLSLLCIVIFYIYLELFIPCKSLFWTDLRLAVILTVQEISQPARKHGTLAPSPGQFLSTVDVNRMQPLVFA